MFTAAAWAGTLPNWLLVVLAVAVAWRLSRGGGGSAVSELSKANEVLTKRVQELGSEVRDLRAENAELRGRTDVALAIDHWGSEHERRAQERHLATLHVLDMIARHLGEEPDGC